MIQWSNSWLDNVCHCYLSFTTQKALFRMILRQAPSPTHVRLSPGLTISAAPGGCSHLFTLL